MARIDGAAMRDLIHLLEEAPHSFDLFQAMSLLERSEPDRAPLGTSMGLDEAARLSATVSLAFLPSDISAVVSSKQPGPPKTLISPTVSLAGAQGPLPLPITELLLERKRLKDSAGLDFLDIFNQRMLAFLYRSRRKHNLSLNPQGLQSSTIARALDGLSGLGRYEGARGARGEQAWLRHAGLQGAAPRSMATLLALLTDRLGIRFSGRQFVGGWFALSPSDQACLGRPKGRRQGSRLGSATLGCRAWDQAAGVELQTPPLTNARFIDLLPGGTEHELLGWLVARHLQSEVGVQLRLSLQEDVEPRVGLAANEAPRLGYTSWLMGPSTGPKGNRAALGMPCFRLQQAPVPKAGLNFAHRAGIENGN